MEGGKILYQGKPIQKYMVNNLDLMEGRYAMINNNLPLDAVKKVQVIENDQPVKILDSLVFSNRASLNLELKKFTTTGTGKIGVGAAPVLWDLNVTQMTFGKTFQMLNSFQTNNTGNDVSRDLKAFYTSGIDFVSRPTISNGESFLAIRNIASPSFEEQKWLNNKIFLFSTNALQKLRSGTELKANVSYYHDIRKRSGYIATQYFTKDEIIYSSEELSNRYRNQVFDIGLLIERNEKNIYLRNSTKFQKKWNTDRGEVLFNNSGHIGQYRDYTDQAFLNNLSLARFIGKQLVTMTSTAKFNSTPQQLLVTPGQFEDMLNNGKPYEQLFQQVNFKKFSFENNIGFVRKIKNWSLSPNLAINYAHNSLQSNVYITDQGNTKKSGEDYVNDMKNGELNFAFSVNLRWEKPKWKWMFSVPYNLYYFNVLQQGVKTIDHSIRNSFNPASTLTYLIDANNDLSASLSGGNTFEGLNNFYNGYIITQYRNMQRYDARLLRTGNKSLNIGYNYKNTITANFANLKYNYWSGRRDYIYANTIDEKGRATTSIIDQNSVSTNHGFSGGLSRYFSTIKTIAKLNASINWSSSDYLINGNMEMQHGRSQSGSVEFINNFSSIISGDYKTIIGRTKSIFADNQLVVVYANHYLNLVISPADSYSFTVSNALYTNNMKNQGDQYFLDLSCRYQIKRWKTDLEFAGQNLLNNNQFIQQFSNNIELIQSYFELRPRQFLISTRFRF
jgi:hypothetical protein